MKIDKNTHTAILIGSINKELKNARRKGTFSVRDIYFLNCIAKTISFSCHIGMTEEQQRNLSIFYHKILGKSNKFCVHEFESRYYSKIENSHGLFIQDSLAVGANKPEVDDFFIGNNGEENEPIPLTPMGSIDLIEPITFYQNLIIHYTFIPEVEARTYNDPGWEGSVQKVISIKKPTDSVAFLGDFTDYGSPENLYNTAQEFFPELDAWSCFPEGTVLSFSDARGIYGKTNDYILPKQPIGVLNGMISYQGRLLYAAINSLASSRTNTYEGFSKKAMLLCIKKPSDAEFVLHSFEFILEDWFMDSFKAEFYPTLSFEEIFPTGTIVKLRDATGQFNDSNEIICP